jgi:hypothetical protein
VNGSEPWLDKETKELLKSVLESKGLSAEVSQHNIEAAAKEIEEWATTLPAATSRFNVRMYFLKKLCQANPNLSLREDSQIADIILLNTGIRSPGDTFERQRPGGGVDHWTVLWRKVGLRFGVEMAMKNQDGQIIHGEFFD